jgi:hypothetical protein
MALTDRERRVLWTRAGNRCAMCRTRLVDESAEDASSSPGTVVGDEAHIVARSPGGPRAGQIPSSQLDTYDNMILLCKIDHKRVDDNPSHYTSDRLRQIKLDHEKWVDSSLEPTFKPTLRWTVPKDLVVTLELMASGSKLLSVTNSVLSVTFDHVEPSSEDEAELIGSIEQDIRDYGDLWSDLGSTDRVRAEFQMTEQINALSEGGLLVYAGRYVSTLHGPHSKEPWPVAVVKIERAPQKRD